MFPMVTSLAELLQLKDACERVRAELAAPRIALGVMIEVPAAALLADAFAEHADFFSIGTNDLTQYTLAIDRQNPALASEADSLHPAVLRLIAQTVQGARTHGRWVGVCGDLAGDPFGAALLTGLGVAELSMAPRAIAPVARLRSAPELQAPGHARADTDQRTGRARAGRRHDMKLITVTLNPAVDATVTLDRLERGHVHRAKSIRHDAGGKGVNVASCLADWGWTSPPRACWAARTPASSRPCFAPSASRTASCGPTARPAPISSWWTATPPPTSICPA